MFHPLLFAAVRDAAEEHLISANGLTPAEAHRQVGLIDNQQLHDMIVQARAQSKCSLPDAALTHYTAGAEVNLPDGHRIKAIREWLDEHPIFKQILMGLISALIVALISGT